MAVPSSTVPPYLELNDEYFDLNYDPFTDAAFNRAVSMAIQGRFGDETDEQLTSMTDMPDYNTCYQELSGNYTAVQNCNNYDSFMANSSAAQSPASDATSTSSDQSEQLFLSQYESSNPNVEYLSGGVSEMFIYHADKTLSCGFPGCPSQVRFKRPCDLRKHYTRHTKNFYCRYPGCPRSTKAGFSLDKDRMRHEARHFPSIHCAETTCTRLFSRMDNMVS